MKNILITGISSGIGKGLAEYYAEQGAQVFGLSRRELDYSHPKIKYQRVDINDHQNLKSALKDLTSHCEQLDLVILNAGTLGKIETMKKSTLPELKAVMDINLWGQKECIDILLSLFPKLSQVIAISSGASVNGNKGWNGYSLSKAALNMLIKIYAKEVPETHFTAFAPGLVDTQMQDLIREVDEENFPTVQALHQARNTSKMPSPNEFAPLFNGALKKLLKYESGSFVDIRIMRD